MKRFYNAILVFTFLLLAVNNSKAANGDTTWVQAHSNVQLDYFNNFDTAVSFPNGNLEYRKIFLHFNLGKYVCPGNPQFCGDWDYDIRTYVMTPTDTFEIGRLITPYAHTGYGRFAANWQHDYIFDVSDYYPILKDSAVIRLQYAGYSGGFTADLKFAFIEGTRERNVVGIDRMWHGGFSYGHGKGIDSTITPIQKTVPPGTVKTAMDLWITGHGGDDKGCAEFCPNYYELLLNNSTLLSQNFFRENCAGNNIYPQSGTWIYNRANWCPGDLVHKFTHTLPSLTPGSTFDVDLEFPAYTSLATQNNSKASYKIEAAVIYYGNYNKVNDASLEDIIAPTNAEAHFRDNPLLGKPKVEVRNTGSAMLSSIKFEYGVVGKTLQTFTWSGVITPSETRMIELPELAELKLPPGDYQFEAKILEANGGADEDDFNNKLVSTFTAAPAWPADFYISLNNRNGGDTKWRVEALDGTVVAENNSCALNAICVDTVHVDFGKAYRLVVSDTDFNAGYYNIPTGTAVASPTGDGLAFFNDASDPAGYFDVRRSDNNAQIPLPAYMTGQAAANFGFGFVHNFYTGFPTSVSQINPSAGMQVAVYPNPSEGFFNLNYNLGNETEGTYLITDLTGKKIQSGTLSKLGSLMINLSGNAPGLYLLQVKSNNATWNRKLILK